MRQTLTPFGYTFCDLEVRGCLHLKSAVTALGDNLLLANPAWLDTRAFEGFELIDVDPNEADGSQCAASGRPHHLSDRVSTDGASAWRREDCALELVDASELAKAEGAVTCCCVLINS